MISSSSELDILERILKNILWGVTHLEVLKADYWLYLGTTDCRAFLSLVGLHANQSLSPPYCFSGPRVTFANMVLLQRMK